MLETIAKGRLTTGRPTGTPAKPAKPAQATDESAQRLERVLEQERAAQTRDQLLLEHQRELYDFETAERAELDREYNNTRDLILAQMKSDDEVVKKYISMI
jgi:hypothetical protein